MKWFLGWGPERESVRWWEESAITGVSHCSEKERGVKDQKKKRREQGREEERGKGISLSLFYPSSLFPSPFSAPFSRHLRSSLAAPSGTLKGGEEERKGERKRKKERREKREERSSPLLLPHSCQKQCSTPMRIVVLEKAFSYSCSSREKCT